MKSIALNKFYYHSILGHKKLSLKKFNKILKTGYIKTRASMGMTSEHSYSKDNEVCLSMYEEEKISDTISSFDLYFPRTMTLLIDRKIKVYKPTLIATKDLSLNLENHKTYTNINNEVRCKEDISVDLIKGICIPVEQLLEDDYSFLLFISSWFNLLIGSLNESSDLPVPVFLEKKLYRNNRLYEIMDYIHKIEKLLKRYNIDIPIYEYTSDRNIRLLNKEEIIDKYDVRKQKTIR